MQIIAVDDERLALKDLQQAIEAVLPVEQLNGFLDPLQALAFAREHQVDVAFLDIQMAGMNGLSLAKQLKDIYPKTNIIFVTSYPEYSLHAFDLYASGYLLKPVKAQAILQELEQLRYPVIDKEDRLLKVQCFGSFEVYANNIPLDFHRKKTKELFAYLISRRGAECSNGEIAAVLWEDAPNTRSLQSNLRNLISDLMQTLREVGAAEVLRKSRGSVSVAMELIDCDYYDFYNGHAQAVNSYMGEFMTQYHWAEFNIGYLDRQTL